jgi:hypothetical protein
MLRSGTHARRTIQRTEHNDSLVWQAHASVQSVRNGTARFSRRWHHDDMSQKPDKQEHVSTLQASVTKEMAKPRMARSAKIAERNQNTTRAAERPSVTLSASVDKIIPSRGSQSEKVQIGIENTDRGHRDLRIESSLTDEHGDDVKLKKGAHVAVTVTAGANPPSSTPHKDA